MRLVEKFHHRWTNRLRAGAPGVVDHAPQGPEIEPPDKVFDQILFKSNNVIPRLQDVTTIREGLHPLLARVYAGRGVASPDELQLGLSHLILPTTIWSSFAPFPAPTRN